MPGSSPTSPAPAEGRSAGRLRVLDAIRAAGPVARIDIAGMTGISPGTVTTITAELLAAGLIEPAGQAPDPDAPPAGRGRPREALQLRANAQLIAGMKVGQDAITVLLTDFAGNEAGAHEHPLPGPRLAPEALCAQILAALAATCAAHGRRAQEVSALGIGLAGQVDGTAGLVHWSSSLTEREVELGAMLAARAPCPVFIENDANLVAKAEQLFGRGRAHRDFLVVTLELGIGLGIVIGGALYRGARGCGAELGHTKVTAGGALCQCGQRGCLEAYAGEYALLQAAAQGGTRHPDLLALARAAGAGDTAAQGALAQARQYFTMGLANLVNLFDPELIILASKEGAAHPLCSPGVIGDVRGLVVQAGGPLPGIEIHGWGSLMWARGAAAYGIEQCAALSVRRLGAS